MARTNKYTSLNFNDIYEKKLKPTKSSSSPSPSPSPSSSSSSSSSFASINTTPNHLHKTHLSAARTHGGMLVLTRPTPKPIPIPQPSPPPTPPQPQRPPTQSSEPDQNRFEQDSISLRPLGRTGSGPSLPSSPSPVLNQERDKELLQTLTSPKPDRFVPPHLRPGFVGREERLGPEVQKQTGFRPREFGNRQGQYGSPGRYGEDGRPKSGGGYERMRRNGGGESDLVEVSRPSSGGNRPNSSG